MITFELLNDSRSDWHDFFHFLDCRFPFCVKMIAVIQKSLHDLLFWICNHRKAVRWLPILVDGNECKYGITCELKFLSRSIMTIRADLDDPDIRSRADIKVGQ